jgi:hypothetical protein
MIIVGYEYSHEKPVTLSAPGRVSLALRLPRALRMAPSLDVARASNSSHYISARGMSGTSNSPATSRYPQLPPTQDRQQPLRFLPAGARAGTGGVPRRCHQACNSSRKVFLFLSSGRHICDKLAR